jgi:hypothetical protein
MLTMKDLQGKLQFLNIPSYSYYKLSLENMNINTNITD